MGCKIVLSYFVFQTSAVFLIEGNSELGSRSSYFATQENKQLNGYVFKRFNSPSLLSCCQECMRNAWCTSTNFKSPFPMRREDGEGICELNKHDISVVNDYINFEHQERITFSMLLKHCPSTDRQDWPDWIQHGRSCYLLLNILSPKWSDARKICQSRGADLPIVRSADENKFILDMILNQHTVQDRGVWLGLYRNPNGDEFHWIDGSPLAGQFSAWANGEPNNSNYHAKCAHLVKRARRRGQWNDIHCQLTDGQIQSRAAPVVLCQKQVM